MRTLNIVIASLVLAGLTWPLAANAAAIPNARAQAQPQPAEDEITLKARQFLEAMSREDFQGAVKDFGETMLKLSGPDKLAPFWKQFMTQVGAYKKQTAARRERQDPYDFVLVTCEFEKASLNARVVFDKDKKIAGFQFLPVLPESKYEPPAYADPSLFTETDVTVGGGAWKLPGTLTVPKGSGPFPGLVLVHGSGPNDRDETIGPNRPFKDLAWCLASRGIAVLRYDKRTKLYGAQIVAEPKLFAMLTVKEEAIDAPVEAFKVLLQDKRVDPGRAAILGHSLGGMLIPRIALAAEKLKPAGFIIMAGLTRPLEDTMIAQFKYLFALNGPLSEESKKQLQDYQAQVDKIKALKASDIGSEERYFFASPAYWLDMRGYYPPEAAVRIEHPMLILQGGRDYQVTTEDLDNWKKALGGRSDVTFKLYPKLNHLFFEGQGLITPNEYQYTHGSVAKYVIDDIAAWFGTLKGIAEAKE